MSNQLLALITIKTISINKAIILLINRKYKMVKVKTKWEISFFNIAKMIKVKTIKPHKIFIIKKIKFIINVSKI